jgi:hypothetical protein
MFPDVCEPICATAMTFLSKRVTLLPIQFRSSVMRSADSHRLPCIKTEDNAKPSVRSGGSWGQALCVSYSGQCYMSQAATGRSGNRGVCAQPCRSPYTLTEVDGRVIKQDKFVLSLKDLNLLNVIPPLVAAGVTSFKIEGRYKGVDSTCRPPEPGNASFKVAGIPRRKATLSERYYHVITLINSFHKIQPGLTPQESAQ